MPVPAEEVRAALRRHRPALACVGAPVLVRTDLWPGNLFLEPSTGEVVGVIDPERAIWGDPAFELAGADQLGRGPVPTSLLEGYATVGTPPDVDDEAVRVRIELYRLSFALVMCVELVPRAYVGDRVEGHRSALAANLRAALDSLA